MENEKENLERGDKKEGKPFKEREWDYSYGLTNEENYI